MSIQVYWIFWEIFKKKKNLQYARSMGSDAITLNFLKKLDSTDCSMWVLEGLGFLSDMM